MANEHSEPKIGAGHAAAMYRQGLAEIRAALYPESNVAQQAQYGLYGTKTPQEVLEEKRADGVELTEDGGHDRDKMQWREPDQSEHERD